MQPASLSPEQDDDRRRRVPEDTPHQLELGALHLQASCLNNIFSAKEEVCCQQHTSDIFVYSCNTKM